MMESRFLNYTVISEGSNVMFKVTGHARIRTIFVFGNSNLAVCDHAGNQIAEMQGPLVDILERAAASAAQREEG